MSEIRQMIAGGDIRVSGKGCQDSDQSLRGQGAYTGEREISTIDKRYKGETTYAKTHFASMSGQWGNEGGRLITITEMVAGEYGDFSLGGIFYSEEGERVEDEYRGESSPLLENGIQKYRGY